MSHRHHAILRKFPIFRAAVRTPSLLRAVVGGINACRGVGVKDLVMIAALIMAPAALGFSPAASQGVEALNPAAPAAVDQDAPVLLRELLDAFGRGDARGVVNCSARRLDVTIFGVSELFSQSQAGYVLLDFFADYPPLRLDVTETSGSADNWFAAGRFWYLEGEVPLSVYFRLRLSGGEWKLREVRIGRTIHR